MEQEEYTREEIDWSYIEFVDNQDVLDLIEKVHHLNLFFLFLDILKAILTKILLKSHLRTSIIGLLRIQELMNFCFTMLTFFCWFSCFWRREYKIF